MNITQWVSEHVHETMGQCHFAPISAREVAIVLSKIEDGTLNREGARKLQDILIAQNIERWRAIQNI